MASPYLRQLHNNLCFNLPNRSAYDRDAEEPMRQADVKPCYESDEYSTIPSTAGFSMDFLEAHGDGDFTFEDIFKHAAVFESVRAAKRVKAICGGPMYEGKEFDETWYCVMRADQIATLNVTLPPYTETFWRNLSNKLYIKGTLEQVKKAFDEHQQGMRNAYAFLDTIVHQARQLTDIPAGMFVVPDAPPPDWKPYRAEGGIKESAAKYRVPTPPILPSPI